MELSVKNFKKILPKELIKKAEQVAVRECDEIEKGHFQAYVDEGKDTFDVIININGKGIIIKNGCDCESKVDFCRHKTALLLFVLKGEKAAVKIKSSKKVDQLALLLEGVDPERLKMWVKDLLEKNKDLGIAFMHQFSENEQYTPADVKRLTLDTVKAVVNNKKNLENSEVKKIVDLWEEIHDPILKQYSTQVADEDSFLNLNALIETCIEVQYKMNTSSTRFSKYVENQLLKLIEPLNQLKDEDYWDIATGYFADKVIGEPFTFRAYYLSFLAELLEFSTVDRKKRLALRLVKKYARVNAGEFYNGDYYTYTIFNIIIGSDLFHLYYQLFKPIRYGNTYNHRLISLLIGSGHLELAEKYCIEQINGNSNGEYSIEYLQFLQAIYLVTKDDKKLAIVLKELFPYTFDFENYLFITSQITEEEEKKKWRSKMLARARQIVSNSQKAMLFSFQLMDYESNYKKMLDYVDSSASYKVIILYAYKMALVNKGAFLDKIVSRSDDYIDHSVESLKEESKIFAELYGVLLKCYLDVELKAAIQAHKKWSRYYMPNRFVVYMSKQLG